MRIQQKSDAIKLPLINAIAEINIFSSKHLFIINNFVMKCIENIFI